ncbi:TPA: LysR substrate-binding domain-containing protein [Serratia liquefaciens]
MIDFNEMFMFAKVIECGGFLAASKKFGIPKSTLSRKISALEQRLNVRLIQRSTRNIMITEIGKEYYQYCVQMIAAAEKAESLINNKSDQPTGKIRITCPTILMDLGLSKTLAKFMQAYPEVVLQVKIFNRDVDIIAEGYDISFQLMGKESKNSNLIMRKIADISSSFMLNPAGRIHPNQVQEPSDLHQLPTVGWLSSHFQSAWTFNKEGREVKISNESCLVCDDIRLLKEAILCGRATGCLPLKLASQEIHDGTLTTVLNDWQLEPRKIVAIYPSRQGLLPAVRALIDFVVEDFAQDG